MSKGDLIKLDENTELVKITDEKYRYVNPSFSKPTAKLSDYSADIKLKVGNEYFKAHKDVLSTASDYFSAMFSHDMVEKDKDYIELRGISLGGFQIMLEYFYHGHITLVLESVHHCLEASRFFHVEWLTKVCCNYLMRHLSVDNCLHILDLTDTYSLADIVGDLYSFIGLNAVNLMEKEMVSQLPYDVILQLVSCDYYVDLAEEMVLGMLVDWANFDFKSRESKLAELLPHVKFHLLPPEQLDNIPEALLAFAGVQQKVDEARKLWLHPHKWSVLDSDLSGRGGREVMVLVSEWNSDKIQMIDLDNPYFHEEPLELMSQDSLADFTSLATLGGFLYCVGGYDTQLRPINSLLMFDPRLRLWIHLQPMKHCRENFPVVVMGSKLYALGGATSISRQTEEGSGSEGEESSTSYATIAHRTCECYDPETDEWTSIPDLPRGVYAHSACDLNGTIYITGGVTDNLSDPVPVGRCYSWSPGDETWTEKAAMLTRRQSHAMFSHSNKIYVMGGYTAGDLLDLTLGMSNCLKNECYDPEADKWVPLMDTPTGFGHIHRTVAIIDEVAYLLGGSNSSKYLHEFHLKDEELVQGAFCGKDFIKLVKLTMYYPRFMPNDVSRAQITAESADDFKSDFTAHIGEVDKQTEQ